MIRNAWMAVFIGLGLLWHECRDDLAIFCYRIGCTAFAAARQRLSSSAATPAVQRKTAGNVACSTPFFTFFTPSTILKDSEN
jgi:hypothetical protein